MTNIFELLETLAEEHHLTTITRVKLKIGQLRQIVPDLLDFAFEAVATGTKAEGAELEIEVVPIVMQCRHCRTEFRVDAHSYICPHCAGTSLDILQGMDIILESVEGEQA